MTKKIIDDWAKIINESSVEDWNDDWDMAKGANADMAQETFREASKVMKDIFASDISELDMITLTMMIVQYKKYGLEDLLEQLDRDISVSDDIKKKFSNLFKKIDYYVSRSGGVRLEDFARNKVYESGISDDEIQEIVMGFDFRGWE